MISYTVEVTACHNNHSHIHGSTLSSFSFTGQPQKLVLRKARTSSKLHAVSFQKRWTTTLLTSHISHTVISHRCLAMAWLLAQGRCNRITDCGYGWQFSEKLLKQSIHRHWSGKMHPRAARALTKVTNRAADKRNGLSAAGEYSLLQRLGRGNAEQHVAIGLLINLYFHHHRVNQSFVRLFLITYLVCVSKSIQHNIPHYYYYYIFFLLLLILLLFIIYFFLGNIYLHVIIHCACLVSMRVPW